jgi:uncharacterized protein involved in exopolysaccharide biosynthesis
MSETSAAAHPMDPVPAISLTALGIAATLLRRRRVLAITAGVVMGIALATALITPRTYTSDATFIARGSEGVQAGLSSLAGPFGLDVSTGGPALSPDVYSMLMQSRAVFGPLLRDTTSVTIPVDGEVSVITGQLATILAFISDSEDPVPAAQVTLWLAKALTAEVERPAGIVRVSVRTESPELSRHLLEMALGILFEFDLDRRQERGAAERVFLENQLRAARQVLLEAEEAHMAFLESNREFLGTGRPSPEPTLRRDRLVQTIVSQQQLVTSLRSALEEARLAEARNTPAITIIEGPNSPRQADARGRLTRMLMGIIVGLMLGTVLAFLFEYVSVERNSEAYREISGTWRRGAR